MTRLAAEKGDNAKRERHMTRNETIEEYGLSAADVADGIIPGPGKFEGERIYAPHFSECDGEVLSAMEEGCGDYVCLVTIDDEDRREFPEVGSALYALVVEDDQGFVSVSLVQSEAKAEAIRGEYAYEEDNEEEDSDED